MKKTELKKTLLLFISLLIIASLTLSGCSSQKSSDATETSTTGETQVTNSDADNGNIFTASEISMRLAGIVSYNGVVYVADSSGVWKKTKGSNSKEYITENPATFIATDGRMILYVKKNKKADVGDFYVRNAEIHSISIDGTDDKSLTECNESAQPFLIYDNKLYYTDFATPERFHRELFALDLNSGETESVAKDVSSPKMYENKIYYTEQGMLQDTENGAQRIFDVVKAEVSDNTSAEFDNLAFYSFNDGAVVLKDDKYYYKNGNDQTAIDNIDTEKYGPIFFFDGITYCIPSDSSDEAKVEMIKAESKPAEETAESEKETEKPATEPAQEVDYSSYLGTWTYTQVPDEIPEEILNNEASYRTYMDHLPVTSLNFKEINGNTAEFELYKGNNSAVSATDVTAEIVDGVISFEYTDGWGSTGHGTITLNGDSVHVYCVEDNHFDGGRAQLNCDETLTR